MRMVDDDLFRVWVVTPTGRIKTIYYQNSVNSPLLDVEKFEGKPGRVTEFHDIDLTRAAKREGYALLKELYRAENRMDDWEVWLDYQENCQRLHHTEEFPKEFLPDEVRRRRQDAPSLSEWKPPERKPQKAKSEKKGGRAAEA